MKDAPGDNLVIQEVAQQNGNEAAENECRANSQKGIALTDGKQVSNSYSQSRIDADQNQFFGVDQNIEGFSEPDDESA